MMFNFSIYDVTKSIFIIFIAVILVIKLNAIGLFFNNFNFKQNKLDKTQITHLVNNIVQAQVVANNEELKKLRDLLSENNSEVLNIVESQGKRISEIGVITGSLKSVVEEISKNDVTTITSDVPEKEIDIITIFQKDANDNKFPIANVYVNPNLPVEDRYTQMAFPIKFNIDIIQTEEENGSFGRFVELNLYSDYIKEFAGKKFPIKITNLQWAKRPIKEKKFRFNPRLGFGFISSYDVGDTLLNIYPEIDLSLFSYGRTKRDLDWRFLTFGVGGDEENIRLCVEPISWNLGNVVPLIENLMFGVSASIDNDIKYGVGVKLSVLF